MVHTQSKTGFLLNTYESVHSVNKQHDIQTFKKYLRKSRADFSPNSDIFTWKPKVQLLRSLGFMVS